MKRMRLAAVLTAAALAVSACAPAPRVVTAVVPYTAVLLLHPESVWNGAADCDVQGQPVIYLHPQLAPEMVSWIHLHESIHVEQMRAWGGCAAFARLVRADSMFQLRIEAEAYCGVLKAQRRARFPAQPTYDSIVRQLAEDYTHKYARDAVVAALPCR